MRYVAIKRFGPIREIDINLDKSLEVTIDPQASGKSTFGQALALGLRRSCRITAALMG